MRNIYVIIAVLVLQMCCIRDMSPQEYRKRSKEGAVTFNLNLQAWLTKKQTITAGEET